MQELANGAELAGNDTRDSLRPGSLGPGAQASPAKSKVFSINRAPQAPKEPLTTAVDAALRAADPELDEILSALEEIQVWLRSGSWNERTLENALRRAALGALRQSMMDREIRNLAVTDELTGLYNRRGFIAAATHQLKLAHRQSEDALLLFCDVDNLKHINDSFGHPEGDVALRRAAGALRETFRDSDICARLGGDEFAVLAVDVSSPSRQAIVPRIEEALAKVNAKESRYLLSFSIGVARFEPQAASSLGELMLRADQEMYADKRSRQRRSSVGRA